MDQQLTLKFSNGWLEKFCNRHSFKLQVAHGESGSIQQDIIDKELPALKLLIQQYHPDDVFNADETGLFYNMPPNKTIGFFPASGLKKNKAGIWPWDTSKAFDRAAKHHHSVPASKHYLKNPTT
ncbi:hypothetical protein [Sporisorium scitamineum]|uniref:HTH CENPB-type domain-containing protein n=1 Tax=Sporisorium scitamineum TaxID=49012 RepID=A0A0F7RYZ4_9BASI|nr:hypothetical protein [Sporisorium scitamineum]